MKQRMLSLLLCCVIFCSAFSGDTLTGKAKESEQEDSDSLEVHEHTDECYRLETSCLYNSGQEEGNPSEADKPHICTEESGCITRVLDCPYTKQEEGTTPEPGGSEGEEEPGDTGEQEKEEEKPEGEEPAVILSWEWIDEEETLVWSEETGQWGLGLPGASEENRVTAEVLAELLPVSITASFKEEQTEVLTLDWDLTTLPEEGVWEGSYVLTAGLPEGYVLGDEALELGVLLEVGEGGVFPEAEPTKRYVRDWEYMSGESSTVNENIKENVENYTYSMDYYLPITSDKDALLKKLEAALPGRIRCRAYYSQQLIDAGFVLAEGEAASGQPLGYVKIEWNVKEVIRNISAVYDGLVIEFDAKPVSNPGYLICVNSKNSSLPETANDTSEIDGILNLTITLHDIHLERHIVPSVNPANTTVNLFDYTVDANDSDEDIKDPGDLLDKNDIHVNAKREPVDRTGVDDWDKGINRGRLFLFGDGNIHAGFWNKGAGASSDYGKAKAGMTGIVKNVLENGYPMINTEEMTKEIDGYMGISDYELCGDHDDLAGQEHTSKNPKNLSDVVIEKWRASGNTASLDYLFDPNIKMNGYKESYEDVKGLFQIDSNGYYYYDMRQNFAEYNKNSNKFVLYDAGAVDRTDGSFENGGFVETKRSIGNFFPFNKGEEVFDQIKADGTLSGSSYINSNNHKTTTDYMNHHLGMTVSIDFRQPLNGQINTGSANNTPMTFQFSGDDDVWIFIDDVLVLDLGGIHSEIYGTIDFSDGSVEIGQSWKTNGFPYKADGTVDLDKLPDPVLDTTLRKQFEKAGKLDTVRWSGANNDGNTFASNTSHTLKMFYLERGNYDSSLALRFNLQTPLYQQVKKVDQNGSPLTGVEFDLYPATDVGVAAGDKGAIECFYTDTSAHGGQKFYVKQEIGSSLIHLRTAADGTSRFLDQDGNYFNFADQGEKYYILKESRTPAGYRRLPVDIVLHYDPSTSMLSVANRWSTGAYACSVVHVAGTGSLYYGNFTGGAVGDTNQAVSHEIQANGLIVAIPLLRRTTDQVWEPLYGSNLKGFISPKVSADGDGEWHKAVIRAALEQAADTSYPNWYISWDEDNLRLTGTIEDLPGLADRYTLMNPGGNGDMQMLYGVFTPEALAALGISGGDAETRYAALGKYVRDHNTDTALSKIIDATSPGTPNNESFSLLNPGRISRDFRSLIYIPNEQRELWVMKIDQDGRPHNGARFGLYSNPACTGTPIAQGTTATVNEQDGTLIFSPAGNNSPGHAQIGWASQGRTHYYLKEISAPAGCEMNPTVIPVVVGTYSIYADAGIEGDGVTVMAGVGRLTQVMRQYGIDDDVDITLRDIIATQQQQPSTNTEVLPEAWQDVKLSGTGNPGVARSMNLHFGINSIIDYGLHDEDGGERYKPYFVTDTGFIRARVQQNWDALTGNSAYTEKASNANKDNLGDADITNLFSLLNIVVVTDPTTQDTNTGRLMIRKAVSGGSLTAPDYTKNFKFTIHLTDEDGNRLPGEYYFYGTDKAGYLSDGDEFPLHHDEQIIILGLPAGTRFAVTEEDEFQQGWYTIPEDGNVTEEIIKDATTFAPFFNSRDPWGDVGVLIIHKAVAGSGDRKKEFTFHITFRNEDGNEIEQSFPYSGSKEGNITSGESIKLSHDQYIMIFLPVGTKYTVSEEEADQEGYVTESRGDSGVIEEKEDYTAVFINRRERERPQEPDPDHSTHSPRQGTHSPDQPGFAVSSPGTSDLVSMKRLLIVLLLSGMGALVFVLWRNPEKCVKWFFERLKKWSHRN